MKNTLIAALSIIAEKLRNNFPDEGRMERTKCLLSLEIDELAENWGLSAEEALILAGIILRKTDRIFEQCTFQDIARVLGISNLELTAHYPLIERLVAGGFITAEDLEIEEFMAHKTGFKRLAVKPGMVQYGFQYQLTQKIIQQLFI